MKIEQSIICEEQLTQRGFFVMDLPASKILQIRMVLIARGVYTMVKATTMATSHIKHSVLLGLATRANRATKDSEMPASMQ